MLPLILNLFFEGLCADIEHSESDYDHRTRWVSIPPNGTSGHEPEGHLFTVPACDHAGEGLHHPLEWACTEDYIFIPHKLQQVHFHYCYFK